jgi:hypothetical protein
VEGGGGRGQGLCICLCAFRSVCMMHIPYSDSIGRKRRKNPPSPRLRHDKIDPFLKHQQH